MPPSNKGYAPQLLKPGHLESVLCNKRSRNNKPVHHNEEQPLLIITTKSPLKTTKTQHSQKYIKKILTYINKFKNGKIHRLHFLIYSFVHSFIHYLMGITILTSNMLDTGEKARKFRNLNKKKKRKNHQAFASWGTQNIFLPNSSRIKE